MIRSLIVSIFSLVLIASCSHSSKNDVGKVSEKRSTASSGVNDGSDLNQEPCEPYDPNGEKRYIYCGTFKEIVKVPRQLLGLGEEGREIFRISTARQDMLVRNLHDTGVEDSLANWTDGVESSNQESEENCDKVMPSPFARRTPDGSCYFHLVDPESFDGKKLGPLHGKKYMGYKNARFGRNTEAPTMKMVNEMEANLDKPNPRLISLKLFSRKPNPDLDRPDTERGDTKEVPTLNLLATSWLQAQNHDWFSHGRNVRPKDSDSYPGVEQGNPRHKAQFDFIEIDPVKDDADFKDGMRIPRTRPDFTKTGRKGFTKTFRNTVTHWWDASHIYGSDQAKINLVRTVPPQAIEKEKAAGNIDERGFYKNGMIAVDRENRRLYVGEDGLPITGFNDNWWIGLELLHSLFAMEHNRVIEELEAKTDLRGDRAFETARLIVSALIAKIHTNEWTPALLDNPALHVGMFSNWFGGKTAFLGKKEYPDWIPTLENLSSQKWKHIISGLVGENRLDLYGIPFTLTEEFVSVYRMHPLVPNDVKRYRYISGDDFEKLDPLDIKETRDEDVSQLFADMSAARKPSNSGAAKGVNTAGGSEADSIKPMTALSWMYSFGKTHPGAMTLHNFPSFMQNITAKRNVQGRDHEIKFDLAAVDIIRDRERHVPRYNAFRRALRLKPISKFEDLTDDPNDVRLLKEIYGEGKEGVEKLDLLVGTLAETRFKKGDQRKNRRYEGHGFGNTPFYIFTLMASRRLMADPFFGPYYTAEHYTQLGLDWIKRETMKSVLLRHYKELKPKLESVVNAFHDWK